MTDIETSLESRTSPSSADADADADAVADEAMAPSGGKAPKPAARFGERHLQVAILFVGIFLEYTMRVNMSVAIVAMLDSASANPAFPEYDWSESAKSVVLSSFYWGYVLGQVPGGHLAHLFGPKKLLVLSIAGASVFTALTPLGAAWAGWPLVCAFRVIQGMCQGLLVPSMHTHFARWIPVEERDTLTTLAYAGGNLGTVVALPACGALSLSSLGWPANFYLFGAFGLVWAAGWVVLGADTPAKHPRISPEERRYIEDSLGGAADAKPLPTPWAAIATSLPAWAILVGNCGHAWGASTLLTEMPSFMASVLGFDMKSMGFLAAVPHLAMFFLSLLFSYLSTLVMRHQLMSITNCRKLFNTIGLWGPMLALIGLGFSNSGVLSVVMLTLTSGVSSAIYVGFNINSIDLAPNFAGTIMGFSNGASNIMSIMSPLAVGAIVTEEGNVGQWRTVFFTAAGIYLVTNTFYLIFASAETQPWNESTRSTRSPSSKRSSSDEQLDTGV